MTNTKDIEVRGFKIAELLEEVAKLNKLVSALKTAGATSSDIEQYTYLKQRYIDELNQLLKPFDLNFSVAMAA